MNRGGANTHGAGQNLSSRAIEDHRNEKEARKGECCSFVRRRKNAALTKEEGGEFCRVYARGRFKMGSLSGTFCQGRKRKGPVRSLGGRGYSNGLFVDKGNKRDKSRLATSTKNGTR